MSQILIKCYQIVKNKNIFIDIELIMLIMLNHDNMYL